MPCQIFTINAMLWALDTSLANYAESAEGLYNFMLLTGVGVFLQS